MATIENVGPVPARDFMAEVGKMDNSVLIAQQCTQQGAIHAVAYLLRIGVHESNALAMLESLRANMELVRKEAERRGLSVFPEDQTGFS